MSNPNDIWTCSVCGFTKFDKPVHNCVDNLKSEIELLRSELETCHKDIDTVLDNRNVGMATADSSLSFRVAELVSNHQSLRAENAKLREAIRKLIDDWNNRGEDTTDIDQYLAWMELEEMLK